MRIDGTPPAAPPDTFGTTRGHGALGRHLVGGFFLVMGGVHLGIVSVDPQTYDAFADHPVFPFVQEGWQQIVMAQPALALLVSLARRDLAPAR